MLDHKIVSKQVWLLSKVTSQIYSFCLCDLNWNVSIRLISLNFIPLMYHVIILFKYLERCNNDDPQFSLSDTFFFRMVDSHFKV